MELRGKWVRQGNKHYPPRPEQPNNNKEPPPNPPKIGNKKIIFKSSLASQKAINFKDYIGTFYIKSGLITVSIKNKP